MNDFVNRIVRYRAINRLSQGEMAKICGVTKETICSIENEKTNPTRLTRAKIEEVLRNAGI